MITDLQVRRFKSIKELDLQCNRVNLFIGKPNTGKSNILEALGMLCSVSHDEPHRFVRMEGFNNLYYDDVLDLPVTINGKMRESDGKETPFEFSLDYRSDEFAASVKSKNQNLQAYTANFTNVRSVLNYGIFTPVKFYRYSNISDFQDMSATFLKPPDGHNLFMLLKSRKNVRDLVAEFLRQFDLKLVLRAHEQRIEVTRGLEDHFLTSYPYVTLSDTIKRMVFYMVAMETNEDSTLVFEEPESNSFPFYTKDLAERIGLDDRGNQFFITTHNPYFLASLIEKTPAVDLSVHITYYEDEQTKVRLLDSGDLEELLDMEPFFNLDRFLGPA